MQHPSVVIQDEHGDIKLACHPPCIALVDLLHGRILGRTDEQPSGLAPGAHLFLAMRSQVASAVPVPGVHDLMAERASVLPPVDCLVEVDGAVGVVVEAHESGFQDAFLDVDPQHVRFP